MIEQVAHRDRVLAVIVRNRFREEGVHFLTDSNLSQQLAYMRHPPGKMIAPHVHNAVPRAVVFTQEVLFLKRGRLRVDFYDDDRAYIESRMLEAGDVILLAGGGHGFEVLEEIEMFEVKQGPYAGEGDKTRFPAVDPARLRISKGEP